VTSTATKDEKDEKDDEREVDEVKPEAVPKDTAAELERVKQIMGAHLGIDMRSPGQVAQADKDAEDAQKELEKQQQKEAAQAEKEAQAGVPEAESQPKSSRSGK